MAATNAGFVNINSDLGESFGPWVMGNDAEVLKIVKSANVACGFPLLQRFEVRLPVHHVVDLHEVKTCITGEGLAPGAPKCQRIFHLPSSGSLTNRPNLGRRKHAVTPRHGIRAGPQQFTYDLLGRSVHGRGVDQRAAPVKKCLQYRPQLIGPDGRVAASGDVESQP